MAEYCYSKKCVKPKVNNRGYIDIVKGRHPLIGKENVVPVSIELGGKYKFKNVFGLYKEGCARLGTVVYKALHVTFMFGFYRNDVPVVSYKKIVSVDALSDHASERLYSIRVKIKSLNAHQVCAAPRIDRLKAGTIKSAPCLFQAPHTPYGRAVGLHPASRTAEDY